MAPEMFRKELRYDHMVDVWSLGAVFFVCLAGYPAFNQGYQDMPLIQQICKGTSFLLIEWRFF